MSDWQSTIYITITLGVITGVAANAITAWVRDTISMIDSKYIDVRGDWDIESSFVQADGSVHIFKERLSIKQQYR